MSRIALVWNAPSRLVDITTRYEPYYRGFLALGWEPVVVTSRQAAQGFTYPTVCIDDPSAFRDPIFWSGLGARVGMVVTWLGMSDVLSAMQRGGSKTISITDSDGYATPRSHPREWLRRMWLYQPTTWLKLKAAGFWLRRYLYYSPGETQVVLNSLRHSDAVIMHSTAAIANLCRFTDRWSNTELRSRMHVVPYPIDELFCGDIVPPPARGNRVVAVSRWDDPQKDAALLTGTLEAYYAAGGSAEVIIVGRSGESWFGALTKRYPNVRYIGVQPRNVLRDLYLASRVILFSSRWETGPIVAGEALASGCTLVGPPLMNFTTYHLTGPFGETSRTRSPRELATVLARELTRWDRGHRDPVATAACWRSRLNPVSVCSQLLTSVGESPRAATT